MDNGRSLIETFAYQLTDILDWQAPERARLAAYSGRRDHPVITSVLAKQGGAAKRRLPSLLALLGALRPLITSPI